MPKTQSNEVNKKDEQQEPDKLRALIQKRITQMLGQPGNLMQVQVRLLWEDHYRVNFVVGVDAASARVAHSYFLHADNAGNIIATTPKITKQY